MPINIAIVGTGYVGLPSGVGFAELGNQVVCIDKDETKINKLQAGELTIYEDGLDELFKKNIASKNLRFTTSMKDGIENAQLVLIAVGTPPHPVTKEADLQYIYAAANEIADYIKDYTVIATKSTVPVGTGDQVEEIIRSKNPTASFDVVSLPEFLREGFAIHDFFNPDRIVIGSDSEKARNVLRELYKPFENKTHMLFVRRRSSETIKYASNAFLAMKIHYINEMADFCEKTGADVNEVAKGMGLDSRIGSRFLNAGPGYGGSCFPKDTNAMAYMAHQNGVDMTLVDATIEGNAKRKERMANRILEPIRNIPDAKVAILGLAFKNGTDDCRESPAMEIISHLLKSPIKITAYDPQAMENAKKVLGNQIDFASDMYEALKEADELVILTEWEDFKSINLEKAATLMRRRYIMDLRNMLDAKRAQELGFTYQKIG